MPNILLITIDCLRADALGCYGGSAVTPELDRLASQGIRYLSAFSHAHFTRPAFVALFSGAYPWQYGGDQTFSVDRPHVVEALQAKGYTTLGVNSNAWLTPGFGYQRGYTIYHDLALARPAAHSLPVSAANNLLGWIGGGLVYPPYPNGEMITDAALAMLNAARRPFYLWLHYMDAHWPYHAPQPRLYSPWQRSDQVYNARLAHRSRKEPQRVTAQERRALRAAYDRAVQEIDGGVGRLLAQVGEETIVMVTADHGEAFGEHGRYFHEPGLYRENVNVPLVLRAPGVAAGQVEAGIVRHIDIAPTLLDLAQADRPAGLVGVSLAPAARQQAALPELEAVSTIDDPKNQKYWLSLRSQGWMALSSYRQSQSSPVYGELYALGADPAESKNLIKEKPQHWTALQGRALAYYNLESNRPGTAAGLPQTVDPEVVERLKALGYLD